MKYIIDTNILAAIIKNKKNLRKIQELILRGNDILINDISYYEIRRGLLARDAKIHSHLFEKICKNFNFVLLEEKSIFDRAAEIYTDLKHKEKVLDLNDADILIATIADIKDCILVTDDLDFQKIPHLKIEKWET